MTFIANQIKSGTWRAEEIPADVVGLDRALTVFRARRKGDLIVSKWHGDAATFCPPRWSDLAIGSGPCGLRCRACFLMLTFREMRDPRRHVLYNNLGDFRLRVEDWLRDPRRRADDTLGIGTDRSDSLLYEGAVPHVRNIAPLFGDPKANPRGCKMILLTKSANARYLADIAPAHRRNIIVTFSLNPQAIADCWEGQWDDGTGLPPTIARRLDAAAYAQDLGFAIRVRLDPILPVAGWEDLYAEFLGQVRERRLVFGYWTLGTYREKNAQLDVWRAKWNLPAMTWMPDSALTNEGTHWRVPESKRIEIYAELMRMIRRAFPFPGTRVGLCKETHAVRRAVGACNAWCNCLR